MHCGTKVWVYVRGRIFRGRPHLCAYSKFDNLIPWHSPQNRKIAASPAGKGKMFTFSTMITIHLNSERDLLWANIWRFWGKKKKNQKEMKKDEYVWLEKIIQIWLNPAELSTLLSTKRLPTEIHSIALRSRDVWQGILREILELDRKRAMMEIFQKNCCVWGRERHKVEGKSSHWEYLSAA